MGERQQAAQAHVGPVGPVGPVGRGLRAGVGVGFGAFAVLTQNLSWWDVAGAVVAMPALATAVAALVSWLATRANRSTGRSQALAAVVVILAVLGIGTAMTYASPLDAGTIYLFVGLSMVVAAVKGLAGCEILALPTLLLRRQQAIWCPLFSPVDARIPTAEPQDSGDTGSTRSRVGNGDDRQQQPARRLLG